ncbi:MAG: hypothetical protein HY914_10255 [Desulfomonile tiedjei]|nr:hypothetical protein [Desulfomonile tiedjei]
MDIYTVKQMPRATADSMAAVLGNRSKLLASTTEDSRFIAGHEAWFRRYPSPSLLNRGSCSTFHSPGWAKGPFRRDKREDAIEPARPHVFAARWCALSIEGASNHAGGTKLLQALVLMVKGTLILWGLFMSAAVIAALVKFWLSGNGSCLNSNCRF